jgi:UDP-N-acetylglucosamine 4,6-dehydratase
LGESLITNANNLGFTRFATARYGNVLGSTGSVLPFFEAIIQDEQMVLPVTDPTMTRFWFMPDDAVEFVIGCVWAMNGGEVFVPKLKSTTIQDLITALEFKYGTTIERHIVGLRPGEKMHEEMISEEEAHRTYDAGWAYVIKPFKQNWSQDWDYGDKVDFKSYTSFNAPRLRTRELQEMIGI